MIIVKEQHRVGNRINIGVLDEKGRLIYDRYVDEAEWDADPEAVTAQIAAYLSGRPAAEKTLPVTDALTIKMDDDEIAAKLREIEEKRLDEEKKKANGG